MQHFVKQRATETGDITLQTPAIDVGGQPLLVNELIVYTLTGTSPQISVSMQTSSDLDTWTPVTGFQLDLNATGADIEPAKASDRPYSRYVRFEIVISGTTTEIQYSLICNTFPSS